MIKRKSFILHHDSLEMLAELSDEQAGKLFKAIASYQKTGAHELEGLMNAVFVSFKNQFDRDNEKYQKICERNKNNGLSGGRPKPKRTQSVIYEPNITQHNPKEPDNDSVNGNDNVNGSKSKKSIIGLRPLYISENLWNDFLAIRKAKKAPMTETALNGIQKEADKAGISLERALQECCSRGWQGFKAEWYLNENRKGNNNGKQSNREVAEQYLAELLGEDKQSGYIESFNAETDIVQ